ncbi:sulfotransferase [uncultured Jatrophihabitans sp.]|uniref:sulfotransferase family protein n=1 Tax=uncultured Jatrophihabitans sp. TaxID=1610747 RepID=UPI0035CA44D4
MNTVRPIFVVGYARSGTTLLSVMLHAHPRIAMPPETRFLLSVYDNRASFGDLGREDNRRRLAVSITEDVRFGDLKLDRDRLVDEIVAAPPTVGSAAGTVWRAFARSHGKARWGEKRPAYWQRMDVILRLFPNAQFVHLVRDGRACVASLKTVDWYPFASRTAMTAWSLAEARLTRLGRRLPAGSYHHLRYEDLLADPRRELEALCGFLGEDFDEGMLQYARAADAIVPGRKTWHDRTRGSLDTSRIEAWRSTLSAAEIGLSERVLARPLTANGYALSGAGTDPPIREVLGYERARLRRRREMTLEQARDAIRVRRDGVPVADQG